MKNYLVCCRWAIVLCLALTGCGNDEPGSDGDKDDSSSVAITGSVTEIGAVHALVNGEAHLERISAAYANAEIGVEYSTDDTFEDGLRVSASSLTGQSFTVQLTLAYPNTKYYYRTFVSVDALSFDYYGKVHSFKTKKMEEDHSSYVDLGLPSGTIWATMNVGATCPEDYGDYFAWGETKPKEHYYWDTYKWCNGSENTMTKYCTISSYGYNGFKDGKTELESEDDAAYANWGRSWRMPSLNQCKELIGNCSWVWTQRNGVKGQLLTGPNGNTLFLPASGHFGPIPVGYHGGWPLFAGTSGGFWSRTLYNYEPYFALCLSINSSKLDWYGPYREEGFPVRPVLAPQN